nr:MAG TPA: hypothetical protein [Caudoviricetes sp.]
MIEPIGVISYDNIIRPLKGLLFLIVDKYRCDACNSGETKDTGKPRTIKIKGVGREAHCNDNSQKCEKHSPPIHSSHLMLIIAKYL